MVSRSSAASLFRCRFPFRIPRNTVDAVIEVRQTETFAGWLTSLADSRTRARVAARGQRLALGNFGDTRSVGGGVSELRLDFGPGYRVYYARRGLTVVILLCGGTKGSQARDIAAAHAMAEEI